MGPQEQTKSTYSLPSTSWILEPAARSITQSLWQWIALGGKMVPFAGYDMPVQYPAGIISEHLHTRKAAGLFDVTHMGVYQAEGPQAALFLDSVCGNDISGLGIGDLVLSREEVMADEGVACKESFLDFEALGFPTDMFPVLFAIPRASGWLAQWQEMLLDEDQRIARPRQLYTGVGVRDYVAMGDR